jgi:hypothetical protein
LVKGLFKAKQEGDGYLHLSLASEQIGMGAGAMEDNSMTSFVNLVDENPVVIQDVAINTALPFSAQGMRSATLRQRLFGNNQAHNFDDFVHVLSALFCKGKFIFEAVGTFDFQQSLTPQIRQQFLKGIKGWRRNLPAHHGAAFLDGSDGFGVGYVLILGTLFHFVSLRRGKRYRNADPPCGYRPGDFKVQMDSAISGNFNRLFYDHGSSITWGAD